MVPSLYVRVYHIHPGRDSVIVRSLTIREGVSEQYEQLTEQIEFPHYT